ncbi:MAG: glutamyl-tRNA reductase [Fusobacteriaceae bacterium]|jgi:glutamyl-tRNA reductase|nr:glutamyl-tRNA reductase [Fusobacteriales bacterium]MDN5303380.1 glutamyl-tRNA reductase [Fusobacteriaceae bacterium]
MKLNNFYRLSINYKQFSLEERENLINIELYHKIKEFYNKKIINGYVVLNTCLRFEIYFTSIKSIIELEKYFNFAEKEEFTFGIDAISKLFEISCGLDSVILGEEQILSQIRKSYFKYFEKNTTNKLINKIFNLAISTGKSFRHNSKINSEALSLENIAFSFIKSHFEIIKNKNIFILGAGEVVDDLLKIFYKNNIKNITIANRTYKNSIKYNERYGYKIVDYNKKYDYAKISDIIIASTSAPHTILKVEEMSFLQDISNEKFFLDLAVPRDIDPKIKKYKNIHLYNLDDLWEVYHQNNSNRKDKSEKYRYVIDENIEKLIKWLEYTER